MEKIIYLSMGRANAVNFRFECFLGHEEHEDYTKCTKENHCQGSCMGKVFLCFLFFVSDQYFSGSKAGKGASPDRFSLCTFVFFVTLAGLPDRSKL